MKHKHTLGNADKLLLFVLFSLLAALAALFVSLVQSVQTQKKLCQSVVPLGKYEYDASFLEQAEKISGLRSITPVCEVAVCLRTEGYTMDTVLTGVEISELLMKVRDAQEAALGNIPALLIGEKSLSGLTDANGKLVSQKKQKEILENYCKLTWEYRLTGAGWEMSGDTMPYGTAQGEEGENRSLQDSEMAKERSQGGEMQDAGAPIGEMQGAGAPIGEVQGAGMPDGGGTDAWKPCTVAAILSDPEKDIYLPYSQAVSLLAGAGDIGGSKSVSKILLTVQGEENYKKAAGLFYE